MKETAFFGGGCFWCTEATFEMLEGVVSVMPGYAGGSTPNPSYEQVCGGETGHAEVIQVEFDPEKISFTDLLSVFFVVHDPTTRNRQGNDMGTQYRSIILTTNEKQKKEAEEFIRQLSENEFAGKKIVTEVQPLEIFYPAEAYHRHYFQKHPEKAYCQAVINPKVEKLRQKFSTLLRKH